MVQSSPLRPSKPGRAIGRFGLYGEGSAAVGAEFVHIETIHARSSQYGWAIAPHAHPGIFQLLLVEAGGVAIEGDRVLTLAAPVLIAVPSGSVHAFRFEEGTQGWVLSLADALLADARVKGLRGGSGVEVLAAASLGAGGEAERLGWLMADLASALARIGDADLPLALLAELALVLALADAVLGQMGQAKGEVLHPRRSAAPADALFGRFRRLVERDFRLNRGVAAYAAALATSTPTLTRACREVAGRSPAEVVQDRRLLEAMRLLAYTSQPVGLIGHALGFADQAYFARFFRARTGMTATAFRQRPVWRIRPAEDALATGQ